MGVMTTGAGPSTMEHIRARGCWYYLCSAVSCEYGRRCRASEERPVRASWYISSPTRFLAHDLCPYT